MNFKSIIINLFSSNIASLLALLLVVLFFVLAVFSYQIMPDNTPLANNIQLSIAKKSPGFSANVLLLKNDSIYNSQNIFSQFFFGKKKHYKEIIIDSYSYKDDTLSYVLYNFNNVRNEKVSLDKLHHNKNNKHIINKTYILGTDRYGRDLLSRVILGTRISFSVGFISVFISLLIGVSLGMISGYYGGKLDVFISWLINVVWSIPTLLLVIAISVVLGKGFWQVFVAVGLTMWVEVARVTRGEVLKISQMPYIESIRSFGVPDFYIMFKHILPNIINPIIIISAANFATSILLESGLSFLGIGVQPPIPSWGMIIRNHYGFIIMDKLYLALIPGLCIVLLVLSFMFLGNRLRDLLDVKSRK